MSDQPLSSLHSHSHLFRALQSAGADEYLSLQAVEESQAMVESNVTKLINALRTELVARFDEQRDHLARIEDRILVLETKSDSDRRFTNGLYFYITVVLAILGYLIKN